MKRLLFAAPPLAGHTNQLIVLATELASRGYDVFFASSELFRERITRAGLHFLHWNFASAVTDPVLAERWRRVWDDASSASSILKGELMMWGVATEMYVPMYRSLVPLFREAAPELVVADSAAVAAMDLAQQHGVPWLILAQFLGSHVPITGPHPRYGTGFSRAMSFGQRIQNRLHPWIATVRFLPIILELERARKACSAQVGWRELYERSLMLVSSVFGIELPRPMPPRIQMVGPIIPQQPEPLNPALGRWLDESEERGATVVYMAFGTLARLGLAQMQALADGLANEEVRVLWSVRKEHLASVRIPPNFRTEHFVPQQSVLSHRAVRLFVSHCGMNSVSEALYWGKPILCIPVFGDQHYNAARVADLGAGLRLHNERLTASMVRESAKRLLNEPQFRRVAERMSAVVQRMRGLQRAADLVETAAEAGVDHLLRRA